jgi:hypothetical protein
VTAPVVFEVEVDNLAANVEVDTPQIPVSPSDPTVVFGVSPGPRGLRGPAGDGAQVFGEVLSGADGVQTVFTTANPYAAGSTAVYLNGLREVPGDAYTETTTTTITFDDPPLAGDSIRIDYLIA